MKIRRHFLSPLFQRIPMNPRTNDSDSLAWIGVGDVCFEMRTHMGEMSYKCSQCTCTRVTNLLTHIEVRAFNCDQCIKYSHEKVIFIKHSLSQAQIYEHKEPTFLTMRSPWFDYQQRICHALCLWVGFLKPKTSCKNIALFA